MGSLCPGEVPRRAGQAHARQWCSDFCYSEPAPGASAPSKLNASGAPGPPGLQPGPFTEDDRCIHKEVAISPFEVASRIVPVPRVLELLPSVAPVDTLRKADELCRDVRGACRGGGPNPSQPWLNPDPNP